MQQKLTTRRKALMGVFAGLLAATMLVFTLLTASGSLHHELHHDDDAAGGSPCAVCLFAKGQVDLPDVSPVFAVGVFLLIGGLIIARTAVVLNVFSLLPPGRAPPRFSSVS